MSNQYYRFFMILSIYNGSPPFEVVFCRKLETTSEKTRARVTTDQQT